MKFRALFPFCVCSCLCVILAQIISFAGAQEASTRDPIRAQVNVVTLRFSVRSADGAFINSFAEKDFEVFENGDLRKIAFFDPPRSATPASGKLWLAFLLDVSGSTFETRAEEILAAQKFLENVHSFTQVGVFGFTDRLLVFQDFTSSREAAGKAFQAARQHLGSTAVYDALDSLIERMRGRGAAEDRKVVIVVSDALDQTPRGKDQPHQRAEEIIAQARAVNVNFYTITVPSAAQLYIGPASEEGVRTRNAEAKDRLEAFAKLSQATSGKHFSGFEVVLDFEDTLASINDDILGNLYTLGFYTDNPYLSKEERAIRLKVKHASAQISGIFQNTPQRLFAKKSFIAALFDNEALSRLPKDLHTRFREIGADLDLLQTRREPDGVGIPFRIKISPYSIRGTDRQGIRTQFGIIGVLLDREGKEVVRLREFFRVNLEPKQIRQGRAVIYTNKLVAPPGIYDLKIAVLEMETWKMTAFENRVKAIID